MQVEKEHCSKGLGKRLVTILERLGKEYGMEKVMLTVLLCQSPSLISCESALMVVLQSTRER